MRETSVQVTFISREQGVIRALYRAGLGSKTRAHLQAFTPCWLQLNERCGSFYVNRLEPISATLSFSKKNLYAGLYVNELLYHGLYPHDPAPPLFDTYTKTLCILSDNPTDMAIEQCLRRFEWQLLTACGYHMSLTHDARSTLPIEMDRHYTLITGEGFVLAERGVLGAHIAAFAEFKLDDQAVRVAAKQIMRCAIDHALHGKQIRARALYASYHP